MKVILRSTRTGLFYAGPDQWTEDRTGAVDFQQTDLALDRVAEARLQGIEVLMHFEDPSFDIPLNIVNLGSSEAF
jgi:hypothetical protein